MRLWHKDLLHYLPDQQLKGQLRELVAIMHDWRDKGHTNHLLINKVMEYKKAHLYQYFLIYATEYEKRFHKPIKETIFKEFESFKGNVGYVCDIFAGWHDKEYLRVCMANLYEKYKFGRGNSRIATHEWAFLCVGYQNIAKEEYYI